MRPNMQELSAAWIGRSAHDLGISPRTVKNCQANVRTRMQAGSLSELVRIALVAGAARADKSLKDIS